MMMNNQSKIRPLFSNPIVITNIERDFTEAELQFLLFDIPMWKDEKEGMLNHRSEDQYLFNSFEKELKDIKIFCEFQLAQYLENIEGVDTDLATLRITQSWLNRTKPQEKHHSHYHVNSYLSAVLYISCLPNDQIIFSNRMHGMFNNMEFSKKKVTVWNATDIGQDVTEGDLIVFPSWMIHYVDLNETKNRERISLSFNTFPIAVPAGAELLRW